MKKKNNVDVLRERFESWLNEKNLPAGSKLPSERELCELLDAKRMTLRQVLIELDIDARIFHIEKAEKPGNVFSARTAVVGLFRRSDLFITLNHFPASMLKPVPRDVSLFGII